MTTGELIFTCGLGLLGLTVVLAILFLIKKPHYTPESKGYHDVLAAGTQKLRTGPTDRRTGWQEQSQTDTAAETEMMPLETGETQLLPEERATQSIEAAAGWKDAGETRLLDDEDKL